MIVGSGARGAFEKATALAAWYNFACDFSEALVVVKDICFTLEVHDSLGWNGVNTTHL